MKTRITTFAITAFTLIGFSPKVEAGGFVSGGYVQIGGYRSCDVPTYTERYLIGYDAWGNPVWGYRTVYAAPRYVVPACPPPRYDAPPVLPVPPPYHRSHGDHHSGRRFHAFIHSDVVPSSGGCALAAASRAL